MIEAVDGSRMATAATLEALARGLLLARDSRDALVAWARVVEPNAHVVVHLRHDRGGSPMALRREANAWSALALPPIPPVALASTVEERHPGASRRDAIDDVLCALGAGVALVIPLEPAEAGAVVVARPSGGFSVSERRHLVRTCALLGHAVATTRRRVLADASADQPLREVAELFDLTRALSSALSLDDAIRACAGALRSLLAPSIGAIVLAPRDADAAYAIAWPEGHAARDAADRASRVIAHAEPLRLATLGTSGSSPLSPEDARWHVIGVADAPLAIALGFASEPPQESARVARSVAASLALSLARFREQSSQEERRFAAAVEDIPLGIVLLDARLRIRTANALGRRLLQSVESWPGQGAPLERIGPASLVDAETLVPQASPGEIEIVVPGSERTLVARFHRSSNPGPDDASSDIVLVVEDVTDERRKARRWLQVEKHAALGVLIAGIVHEINNPLATVLGYAQMLAAREHEAPADRWIATIAEEAQRCQRIVRDMLDVARPREAGRRAISAAAIAEKALSLVAHPMRKAAIESVLRVDAEAPSVVADPDALLRVFLNVLTNAIHALESHAGARLIEVRIERASRPNAVAIVVQDTGPGIRAEHQDRIFDPFFTTKEEGKGSGLGLALVASAVRDHGGEIEVESAPGQGARFTITLPASEAALDDTTQELAARAHRETRALAGVCVLVADDEPSIAGLLREVLEAEGARVTVVGDGVLALERLLAEKPDVAVIDLQMPRLSGDGVLAEVRRAAPSLIERIVFATGDLRGSSGSAPFEHAGRPCLAKPFDLSAIVTTVRECVRGRRASLSSPEDTRPFRDPLAS